jgi:hypothetical protein
VRTCSLIRTIAVNILFDILVDLRPGVLPYDKVLTLREYKVACERIIVMYTYDLRS